MKLSRQLVLGLAAASALLCGYAAGEAQVVVDRIAAVVNRRVVLESELDQNVRVESLLQNRPLGEATLNRQEALDQWIDRLLLEQQIVESDVVDPTAEELSARLKEVRAQVTGAATDEGWQKALTDYGVTERDVENHLISEFRLLRFVDLRFRGLVRVDKTAIAEYYQAKLLPELARRGAPPPPLADVSGKIENILVEQRMDSLLNDLLQTLHAQAHIEKMAPFAAQPPEGQL
jgi:parvulin-like peptidyl-prolyl isomerase